MKTLTSRVYSTHGAVNAGAFANQRSVVYPQCPIAKMFVRKKIQEYEACPTIAKMGADPYND
jgi:hypothetical protein